MADLTELQSAQPVKVVGSNASGGETNPVDASANREQFVVDRLNGGGVSATIAVTTTPVEAKVGASALVERKSLAIQPLDGKLFWGYSNVSQPFELARLQPASWNAGPATAIWIAAQSGTVQTAVGEAA